VDSRRTSATGTVTGIESATGDVAAGAMVDAPTAVGALARFVRERAEVAS
jgi:hypothetical protein